MNSNTTYQKYDNYRDSNTEWIGMIPDGWEIAPLKALLIERKEKNNPVKTENILSLSMHQGVIPYADKEAGGNKAKSDLSAYNLAYPGDIVMNSMNVIAGSVGLSDYFGAISPVYYAYYKRDSSVDIDYVDLIFQSEAFQKSLLGLGNGILVKTSEESGKMNTIRMRIPAHRLKNLPLPYPKIEIQKKIKVFLNDECGIIDQLIKKKQKLIDLLQEKRQALITQAVTKGLDPNAKMKDSGVEWIGEIPEGWEVRRVNDLFTISRGRVIPKTELDEVGKYPVYSSQTLNDGLLGMINTYDFEKDILTWTTDGALAGTVFKRTGKYSCTNICGMMIPRSDSSINLDYMLYAVQHSAHENKRPDTNGFKIMSGEMKKIYITKPPIETQNMIAHKLNRVINNIISVTKKLENQISKLNEYKSALIYNAVTGKIKV